MQRKLPRQQQYGHRRKLRTEAFMEAFMKAMEASMEKNLGSFHGSFHELPRKKQVVQETGTLRLI